MTVTALLAELRGRDIQIMAEGDRLRCNAPANSLTPELRVQLQQRKQDILNFLRSADELSRQQRAIVPLQPRGWRIPVFAVAGHNGDIFCYRALAQRLGENQPFYGLEPPGRDGLHEPLTSVEELASYFAAQIRTFRPGGKCIIAGYCAGGTIAFELARQLLREQAVIPFLALFGAPYPASYRRLPQLRRRLGQQVERAVRHVRALSSLTPARQRSYIAERLRNHRAQSDAERSAAPDAVLLLRAKLERATFAAARRYSPGHFPGHVSLFLPSKEWVFSGNQPLRWRSVAQHAEEYFGPDGCNSDTMLREPFASAFAELFEQCCARNAK